MTQTPQSQNKTDAPEQGADQQPEASKQPEGSTPEHHVPGADGPIGAEAEEDNNP